MAIYYSRLAVVSRARGHSAVAAAAYRSAARLSDERTGTVHDFRKKRGVMACGMLAPDEASWALDVPTVWNRAEQAEKRCNARVARELIVALPAELEAEAQLALAQRIGRDLVEHYGVAVLVAVHAPDPGSDARNVHVHLLMTVRTVTPNGLGAKVRCLDDQKTGPIEAEAIRARAAARINAALADHGHAVRVDPRRLRTQAEDAAARGDFEAVAMLVRTPMRHVGRAATAASRRGEPSPLVSDNDAIRRQNRHVQMRGIIRATEMRREIRDQLARRETKRAAGASGVPIRLGGARPMAAPRSPARSSVAAFLDSLRDTERFVADQIRSGERADAARERTERLARQANAVERRARSVMQRELMAMDDAPAVTKPAASTAPVQPAVSTGPSSNPASLTAREWAELRRRRRAEREALAPSPAKPTPRPRARNTP